MIKRFLGSAGWVLSANIGSRVIGFVLLAALTFFISPYQLGIYGAISTAAIAIIAMSSWGVPVVLQRDCAKKNTEQLGRIVVAGIAILCLGIVLSLFIIQTQQEFMERFVFKKDIQDYKYILPWLIIVYFLARLPLTIVLGLGEFRLHSLRNVFERVLLLICVTGGVIMDGLDGAIIGLLVAYTIAAIFTLAIFRRVLKRNSVRFAYDRLGHEMMRMLKEGYLFFLGNTFPKAAMNFVVIAVFTTYLSYQDYGFLRAGLSIVGILAIVPAAMRPVTITYIAKYEGQASTIKSVQLRVLTMGIVSISLLLIIFIEDLVGVVLGPEYVNGVYLFKGLLLVNIIHFVGGLINSLIVGSGHLTYSGFVGLARTLAYTVLLYLLVPTWGITGFLIALGVSNMFTLVAVSFLEFKKYKHDDMSKYVVFTGMSLVVVSVVLFVDNMDLRGIWDYVLQIGIFSLYILGGYVFVLKASEKVYMKNMLSQLKLKWA